MQESLTRLGERIQYLRNLRQFVASCKALYENEGMLPDLFGKGNIIPHNDTLYILDFNNISFEKEKIQERGKIHLPLDNRGIPIFDLSLDMLYRLEKYLLSYAGNNFSSKEFNKYCYKECGLSCDDLIKLGIFRPREELQANPFYGALRFKKRREMVNAIMQANHIV